MIYPCVLFNGKAKEAAEFYCSVLENSIMTSENELMASVETDGQKFICLNGPEVKLNPSISFYILFDSASSLNKAWNKLQSGGSVLMPLNKYAWSPLYGWLQDKYGLSWQLTLGRIQNSDQRLTPLLMFTGNQAGKAEEAVKFYTSIFKNSGVKQLVRYEAGEGDVEGTLKHAQFNLGKNTLMAMDSSLPHQSGFNDAISLMVECNDQQEIDYYWEKLTDGGQESMCGWLKDKYGVSWQIVPSVLGKLLSDPSRAERVVNVFLKMRKFDISQLINA